MQLTGSSAICCLGGVAPTAEDAYPTAGTSTHSPLKALQENASKSLCTHSYCSCIATMHGDSVVLTKDNFTMFTNTQKVLTTETVGRVVKECFLSDGGLGLMTYDYDLGHGNKPKALRKP